MHQPMKRLLALAALSLAAGAACAQSWPTQPVRWIVPYPAGGGTDVVARTVGSGLEKPLGQTIVVENRPGAGTIIGATAIAQAEPNGYMVGTADSGTLAFNSSLYSKLSYDPAKFTYIGGIAKFPLLLAVNVNSPYKTVDDVLAAAKKEPGKLSAASAGGATGAAPSVTKAGLRFSAGQSCQPMSFSVRRVPMGRSRLATSTRMSGFPSRPAASQSACSCLTLSPIPASVGVVIQPSACRAIHRMVYGPPPAPTRTGMRPCGGLG